MILKSEPPLSYGTGVEDYRKPKPVDKSRVWGMTGWEDQSGPRPVDGRWPAAALLPPPWRK